MADPLQDFVEESHKEKERASLQMKKVVGGAGFCLRAKGGKKAIDKLAEIMNKIDLTEHQP